MMEKKMLLFRVMYIHIICGYWLLVSRLGAQG